MKSFSGSLRDKSHAMKITRLPIISTCSDHSTLFMLVESRTMLAMSSPGVGKVTSQYSSVVAITSGSRRNRRATM